MAKLKFKQGIIRALSPTLGEMGYAFVGYYPPGKGLLPEGLGDPDYLYHEKALPEMGMRCYIGVQLSQHALPQFGKREFTVFVMRAKDVTAAAAAGGKQLGTRLPDLLRFHFNVPVHIEGCGWWGSPPGAEEGQQGPPLYLSRREWWQFETQEEFEAQLANVLEYLVKYAIPWLEDPQSELPPWGYFGPPPVGWEGAEE